MKRSNIFWWTLYIFKSIFWKILCVNIDFSNYVNKITALLIIICIIYNNFSEINICLEDWICFTEDLNKEVKKGNQEATKNEKSILIV